MERNSEIDGIRGWAALLVLTFHFFKETFTGLFSELNHPGYGIKENHIKGFEIIV
jgi:peptidoglycan/LPS O-acetylase OafA/YrhL